MKSNSRHAGNKWKYPPRAFSTTPGLWLNMQKGYDLWIAENERTDWQKVKPVYVPEPAVGEAQT